MIEDIRWVQRYQHFCQAFEQMKSAVELARQRDLSDLEEQGMIQAFEYGTLANPCRTKLTYYKFCLSALLKVSISAVILVTYQLVSRLRGNDLNLIYH